MVVSEEASLLGVLHLERCAGTGLLLPVTVLALTRNFNWFEHHTRGSAFGTRKCRAGSRSIHIRLPLRRQHFHQRAHPIIIYNGHHSFTYTLGTCTFPYSSDLLRSLYSFFGCGCLSIARKNWGRIGAAITGEPIAALAIFMVLCFEQGLGNVLAGSISSGFLWKMVNRAEYGVNRYKAMVIFTGCWMAVSTISIGSWYLRPSRMRT